MEKITEITSLDSDFNAFELIKKCKAIVNVLDLTNIITDNQSYEEKEMLIDLINSIKRIELEIIEVELPIIPKAKA